MPKGYSKILVTALLAVLCFGCATNKRNVQPEKTAADKAREAFVAGKARCEDAWKRVSPLMGPLASRPWLFGAADTIDLTALADRSTPTDAEKKSLAVLDALLMNECNLAPVMTRVDGPEIGDLYQQMATTLQQGRAHLYNGSITYGDYASLVKQTKTALDSALTQVRRQQAEIAHQHELEAERAQAAASAAKAARRAAALQLGARLMQGTPPPPVRPIVNCHAQTYGRTTDVTCQ